jgi:hypothetical protein
MRVLFTSVLFWGLLIAISIPPFFVFGPDLEARLFPVLGPAHAVVTRDGNHIAFTLELIKYRFCRLQGFNWQAVRQTTKDGPIEIFPLVVTLNGEVFTGTLPEGRIRIGPYETTLPDHFANATGIQAIDYFDCHPLWLTRAVLGPIPVLPPS